MISSCNKTVFKKTDMLLHKEENNADIRISTLKANSHGMFSIYVFCAYMENISSEMSYALLFLSTCGKHTK